MMNNNKNNNSNQTTRPTFQYFIYRGDCAKALVDEACEFFSAKLESNGYEADVLDYQQVPTIDVPVRNRYIVLVAGLTDDSQQFICKRLGFLSHRPNSAQCYVTGLYLNGRIYNLTSYADLTKVQKLVNTDKSFEACSRQDYFNERELRERLLADLAVTAKFFKVPNAYELRDRIFQSERTREQFLCYMEGYLANKDIDRYHAGHTVTSRKDHNFHCTKSNEFMSAGETSSHTDDRLKVLYEVGFLETLEDFNLCKYCDLADIPVEDSVGAPSVVTRAIIEYNGWCEPDEYTTDYNPEWLQ